MPMPWENPQGGLLPWQVGQYFVQADGSTVQVYPDKSGVGAQTGFVAKITRPDGTVTYQAAPAPINPTAAYDYLQGTPYGQSLQAAERAAADQNTFNRGITERTTAVSEGTLGVNRQNAGTAFYNAETTREIQRAQVEQAKQDLQFKYYQQNQNNQMARGQLGLDTLKVGSSLTGPRNWDRYLETAAAAGQNPMLQGAVGTWASLTGQRPNTGAVSGPMPQKFDLNALASDFSGQGVSGQAGQRIAALDTAAMTPGMAGDPNWWIGMSASEKERAKGYWESNGWDPSSVLNALAYNVPTQGLGYGGA